LAGGPLRSYLQAMGADLQIKTVFKDQEVVINLLRSHWEATSHTFANPE
jgi:hypothetical protein